MTHGYLLIECNSLKTEHDASSCLSAGSEETTRRSKRQGGTPLYTTRNKTHDDLDQNCGRGFTKHPKTNRHKPSSSIITTKEFNSYTIVCRSTVAYYTSHSMRALQGSKGQFTEVYSHRHIFIIGTLPMLFVYCTIL